MNARAADIDSYVESFERARAIARIADLLRFAPPPSHELHAVVLRELVRVDLEFGWAEGRPVTLTEYQSRYPAIFADPLDAREIAFEDYRLRRQAGQHPDLSEYRDAGIEVQDWPNLPSDRFGISAERLASAPTLAFGDAEPPLCETGDTDDESPAPSPHVALFRAVYLKDCDAADRLAKAVRSWPDVGDVFCGFRLVAELGRGAFGRVFLAEQRDLANRPVALKVVRDQPGESQRLAQLQHTNIVPIYSRHSAPPFHGICMPYFGGVSLAEIARTLQALPAQPNTGAALVSQLRNNLRPELPGVENPQALEQLSRLSFAHFVLRLAERLADGLAHAHERGILHRDIKPANVLLAADGQPMLLDFNLAADAASRKLENVQLGGTLPYMPPEALDQMQSGGRGITDARGDVYALGVVLWELLARRHPFTLPTASAPASLAPMIAERRTPPDIRALNPAVSPAFAAIVMRCLAAEPSRRYQSARDLQEDLYLQLDDQPLKHTRESSWRERFGKWLRRHPRSAIAASALIVLGPIAGIAIERQQRVVEANALQSLADFRDEKQRAWMLLNVPHALGTEQAEGISLATRAIARFDGAAGSAARKRLAPHQQAEVARGTSELLFASAAAAARSASWTTTTDSAHLAERARASPPTQLIARYAPIDSDVRHGRFRAGIKRIRKALAETPDDPALWFLLADCYLLVGDSAAALGSLDACLALYPNFYRTHYQRGIVRLDQKLPLEAKAEFDAALALERDFWPAHMQRAVASAALGDIAGAMTHLDRVAQLPEAPAQVEFMRARLLANAGDRTGAARAKAAGLARPPIDADDWVVRGLSRIDDDPKAAMGDFERALAIDPRHRPALRNQANLLAETLGQLAEAVTVLDRLVEFTPDSGSDLAGRGVVLGRLGKRDEAHRDAVAALNSDARPFTRYQVAGIYALTSRYNANDALEAVRLLTVAIRSGVGLDLIDRDSDLDPIRQRPEFRRLVEAARALRETDSRPSPSQNSK